MEEEKKVNPSRFTKGDPRAKKAGALGGAANKRYNSKRSVQAAISSRANKAAAKGKEYVSPSDIVLDMLEELHRLSKGDPMKFFDEKMKLLKMAVVTEDKYSKVARKDLDSAVSEEEYKNMLAYEDELSEGEVSDSTASKYST